MAPTQVYTCSLFKVSSYSASVLTLLYLKSPALTILALNEPHPNTIHVIITSGLSSWRHTPTLQSSLARLNGDFASMESKNRIGSKDLCNHSLIRYAFAPSLVGSASPVLEILLLFIFLQNSLLNHGLLVHGVEK